MGVSRVFIFVTNTIKVLIVLLRLVHMGVFLVFSEIDSEIWLIL